MATIDLVYFDAGGGHRAAALALRDAIVARTPEVRVRLVHFFKVLDPHDRFRRLTGIGHEDLYNKRLQHGLTLGLAQELRLLQGSIRLGHRVLVDLLGDHWRASPPDLVVSLIPNFNRALGDSVARALPGVPFATVLTDLADHPPHFWIEPEVCQHVICGTPHAVAQARAAGLPDERIHAVAGMLLRPAFLAPPLVDRAAARAAAGLDASAIVGLVMFGGAGSRLMAPIAAAIEDVPLILLCGRNEPLAARMRRQPARAPRVVVGYTPDVAHYMRMADFFIGKPGPGSLSEAVQLGLPVIVSRNAWTMPQERYNTVWVRERGLGVVVPGFRRVADGVQRLLADLPTYQAATRQVDNRAATAIPEVLERLLADRVAPDEVTACRLLAA